MSEDDMKAEEERPAAAEWLPVLGQLREPLFALLDAARDARVLQLLAGSGAPYASLYTGPEGDALAEVAPYLVALSPDSELLRRLLDEGWGRAWGVFVTSPLPLRDLRRHFRRFLLVEDEQGRALYFRFHDPRVLRVFLVSCPPEHRAELFGKAVTRFLMEASDASLSTFDATPTPASAAALPSESRGLTSL